MAVCVCQPYPNLSEVGVGKMLLDIRLVLVGYGSYLVEEPVHGEGR